MVAWYSKSIICSSSVSFFHWHPLTVCLMWRSRSAIVSDSSCLKSARYVSLKCQNEVDCFEALLESVPYLIYLLTVLDCLFKSVPAVVCFVTSCHKYEGPLPLLRNLVCHKDHLHSLLEEFSMWQPCQLLSSSSPDTSPLGPTA